MSYLTWLSDPTARRCILIEADANVSGVETTFYMSTCGYVTGNSDSPANTVYDPCINGGVSTNEELSLDSSGNGISYGDVQIDNTNGVRDIWLSYIWCNRQIKIYHGDLTWARSSFQLVFDGIIYNLDSKDRNSLNFILRDKMERLNCAVTTEILGGTTENKNFLKPLVFGECCNITPLLTNPATHTYQAHNGHIENIIEVRDNGVPVTVSQDILTGKFNLTAAPAGLITCSVQGSKLYGNYFNTIAKIIQQLATEYGKPSSRFTIDDIDTTNMDAFDYSHQQYVGVYLSDRQNVIDIIKQLANSIGAQAIITRAGKLALLQIALPATGTPTIITSAEIVANSLRIVNRIPVKARSQVGYCKNWTVQTEIATGIPEAHRDLFAQEWRVASSYDSIVEINYKLDDIPEPRDTLLLSTLNAEQEALREVTLYKTPRIVYGFEGYAACLALELGGTVTIKHNRFNLSSGKTGIITRLQPDWINNRCQVEVII